MKLPKFLITPIRALTYNPFAEESVKDKGQSIVDVAMREVGTKESPKNSNETKYGKWFGWDGVAWCGIFVSWVYAHAGYPLGNIGFRKGFAGCQSAVAYFKKHNKIVTDPQLGDIVFFDWNNDKRYDHTGIFVKWNDDRIYFDTIEGNTSKGNNSNGGKVCYRNDRHINNNPIFVRP